MRVSHFCIYVVQAAFAATGHRLSSVALGASSVLGFPKGAMAVGDEL